MARLTTLWLGIGGTCLVGVFLMRQSSKNLQIIQQHLGAINYGAGAPSLSGSTTIPKPDAYMDGQSLRLVQGPPPASHVHCLSENFAPENSWMYRSCHFENLCFDVDTNAFVLHPSARQQHLEANYLRSNSQTFLSTVPKEMISGGQHASWLKIGRGKWIPESRDATNVTSYYALDANTVWVSYFPWGDCNAGHTLWDSFLPIYTLLEMFDLLDDKKLFLTEMYNANGDCPTVMQQWAPMMGQSDSRSSFTLIDDLSIAEEKDGSNFSASTRLVCAKHAANGMGWLTDHGLNKHGSQSRDFANPHNIGRARTLRNFRNYALSNLGLMPVDTTQVRRSPPYQVTLSILSSRDTDRRFTFGAHVKALRQELDSDLVRIERIAMWNYTLRQQVEIATRSSFFVTIGGGGSSPAFFLPKGATLIIYGKEGEKFDWDLWNNYANIQVHWLSTPHMQQDIDLFIDIVRIEIDRLLLEAASRTNIM